MENNFNLKKFLTENKLTNNSKILSEASGKSEALAKAKTSHNKTMSKLKGQSQGASGGVTRAREDKEIERYEKEVERINKKFTSNEVADGSNEMIPNDIIWTDEDEDTASQGTFNQFDQSAEDLDGYEVEVLGYSPSTGKAYVGSTFGSYGETAFDDVDDIRQMNSKETGYYMDALKQYEPEHFKKMSQLNQGTNEVAENFLDAVFNSLNDMMRTGEISGEEFDAAKNKLDNNPASLTPFEKKKDVQAAAESLLGEVNEVADSGDEMVLLSISNRRLNASAQDISRILQKKAPGTFYIVRGNGGEPNETREVSREEALDYVEYYRSKTPPNLDQEKEELLGTKLKVLGWESHLSFRPDSMDETNEDQERDHQFSANQEEEEIVMQIAKDAIALIDEQPGTDAVSALLATIEFLDD